MDRPRMLPAARKFVDEMRDVCVATDGPDDAARWERCRELLVVLLADADVQAHARSWPVGGYDGKKVENLLFYEDPDYGFVLNGLIKNPGGLAVPHDHGKSWTVYGVLSGSERVVRLKDGAGGLEEDWASNCGPGTVDIVPPWEIHAEYAGDEKTVAVIVRSQRSGTFDQYRYVDGNKEKIRRPGTSAFRAGVVRRLAIAAR